MPFEDSPLTQQKPDGMIPSVLTNLMGAERNAGGVSQKVLQFQPEPRSRLCLFILNQLGFVRMGCGSKRVPKLEPWSMETKTKTCGPYPGGLILTIPTYGCGSKPMGSYFGVGEFTTHFCGWIGMFTGG